MLLKHWQFQGISLFQRLEQLFRWLSRQGGMNGNKLLRSLVSLLIVPACVTEPDLGETGQALTAPVAPIDTFELRGDHVFYIGNDGTGYRAYELDENLAMLRKSTAVASVPDVENLTTDGT